MESSPSLVCSHEQSVSVERRGASRRNTVIGLVLALLVLLASLSLRGKSLELETTVAKDVALMNGTMKEMEEFEREGIERLERIPRMVDASTLTATLPTMSPTASPTSSPVVSTLTPTTTEHLVKDWPRWKASLAVKRVAATTSVNPRHATHAATRARFPPPDAPLQLLRVPLPSVHDAATTSLDRTNYNVNGTSKPIMAIITSTCSKGQSHLPVQQSVLAQHLLPSIVNTISESERHEWQVHVYVAVDDTDAWWLDRWSQLPSIHALDDPTVNDSWLNITFGVFPTRPGNIPFNEMALVAYRQHGAEYLCRVNDDSELTSTDWITTAVSTLRQMNPPNVGVVAPTCGQGHYEIMTHDLVHRTHLDIFDGYYYPPCFDNWYLDDWMSSIYHTRVLGPHFEGHAQVLESWSVKHWIFTQRYSAKELQAQWLPWEYERGRALIAAHLQKTAMSRGGTTSRSRPTGKATTAVAPSLPRPRYMDPRLVQRVLDVLPPNGNLLVWGFNGDSPYWHLSTSGAVVFWAEPALRHIWFKYHPYVLLEPASFDASVRGNMASNAERYAQNQTLADNAWCNLALELPESIRDTVWDVILVEAPMECANTEARCDDGPGPGVYQPLYNSQVIAAMQRQRHHMTHVLVHHYERTYERDFAQQVFGARPHKVTVATTNRTRTELAHFVVDATSPIRPPDVTKVCHPVVAV